MKSPETSETLLESAVPVWNQKICSVRIVPNS